MVLRPLGRTGLHVSPVGFGAFKIGRNMGIKYPAPYALPDDQGAAQLLNAILDLGINYIDTAPAYGLSEARIGAALAGRRTECVLSTKVGETFMDGRSRHDFSAQAIRTSVADSLRRLRTACVDVLFLHLPHEDLAVLTGSDAVATLLELRTAGSARAVGASVYTLEAARHALGWADALMLEYRPDQPQMAPVLREAAEVGVGVVIKKALGAGRLAPLDVIPATLAQPAVASIVIGSLSLAHLEQNVRLARRAGPPGA